MEKKLEIIPNIAKTLIIILNLYDFLSVRKSITESTGWKASYFIILGL